MPSTVRPTPGPVLPRPAERGLCGLPDPTDRPPALHGSVADASWAAYGDHMARRPMAVRVRISRRTLAVAIALQVYIAGCFLVALGVETAILGPDWTAGSGGDVLQQTWNTYRRDFISRDGRVTDRPPLGYGETTSEGQAYAMLRAVWIGDRPTFDRTWRWTQVNLQVRGDSLFGWLWGRDQRGRWTLLNPSTAADADEDVALALVFAGHRWADQRYLVAARAVLSDLWAKEVVNVGQTPYLVAGDWAAARQPQVVTNPSYLAPYAYRVFAAEDPGHPWSALVASSYEALDRCSWSRLNEPTSVGLPPNWCVLFPGDGGVHAYWDSGGDDYGYDAFRVMWRVALDYEWNGSAAARSYLTRSRFLRSQWQSHHRLVAMYGHNGAPGPGADEEPVTYAGDIGNFVVVDPAAARSIVQDKLLGALHRSGDVAYWGDRTNYYSQNWIWFGFALSEHRLVNLAQSQQANPPPGPGRGPSLMPVRGDGS
jgi:endo-1,4-beta-D-glucanase Y